MNSCPSRSCSTSTYFGAGCRRSEISAVKKPEPLRTLRKAAEFAEKTGK